MISTPPKKREGADGQPFDSLEHPVNKEKETQFSGVFQYCVCVSHARIFLDCDAITQRVFWNHRSNETKTLCIQ